MSEIIFGFDQDKVVNLQPVDKGCNCCRVTIEGLAMLYAMKRLYDLYDKDNDGYMTIRRADIYEVMPMLGWLTSYASKMLMNTLIAFGLIEAGNANYYIWNWIIRFRLGRNFNSILPDIPSNGA